MRAESIALVLILLLGVLLPPADARADSEPAGVAQRATLLEDLPPGARLEAGSDALPGAARELAVEYTVDAALDRRLREVLERHEVGLGHVILMDPATGEVFAYVSSDARAFPATRAYPTASLMKLVTAAAVLRNAPEAAGRSCRYFGSPYAELLRSQLVAPQRGGHVQSFPRAIATSNNICFGRLAVRDVGREPLLDEIARVGLLESPAPRHDAGRLDPVEDALDLARLGSGLSGSFVTPLGAARLAALLATGELVKPYWVARIRDAQGRTLALPAREAPRPVWSSELARELRELTGPVTAEGTARGAFHDAHGRSLLGAVRVAGKTGTLSGTSPPGRYQWFIGVAPLEAPRIAIASLVVNETHSGTSASRLAALALREVFCAGGECNAEHAEFWHSRSRTRDAEARREIAERELARLRAEREALERARRLALTHEVVDLDRTPSPIGARGFDFPRHLLRHKAEGRIVLLVELSPQGGVTDVRVDSSNLPDFESFVVAQVREWRFTPPTLHGVPVKARARLPIPIHVE